MNLCHVKRGSITLGLASFSWILLFMYGCSTTEAEPSASPAVLQDRTIGHSQVNAAAIPLESLDAARGMDVYLDHASVGGNILEGLKDLQDQDTRYSATFYEIADDAAQLAQSHTDALARGDVFLFNARGNPGFSAKLQGFDNRLRSAVLDSTQSLGQLFDAAGFKFCFIDNDFTGFANDIPGAFAAVRDTMEALERAYPDCSFFWTTMPICTTGDADRDAYNTLVRNYCTANQRWLLDIADIESHASDGSALRDQGGLEYMDASYSDDGGHLNAVGRLRVAQAWWYLLARIAGWQG